MMLCQEIVHCNDSTYPLYAIRLQHGVTQHVAMRHLLFLSIVAGLSKATWIVQQKHMLHLSDNVAVPMLMSLLIATHVFYASYSNDDRDRARRWILSKVTNGVAGL